MAGWTESPPGTWTITPTIVVPVQIKDKFEQIREWMNFLYFTTTSEMSDEEFVGFLITGKVSDRSEPELSGQLIPPRFSFGRLWIDFKRYWLNQDVRTRTSTTDGDVEALAVVVPAPPAP